MSGVRNVRYGARDREWGALALLTRVKKPIVFEGPHPVVEIMSLALSIVRFVEHPSIRSADFIRTFSKTNPTAGRLAQQWIATGFLASAMDHGDPVDRVIDAVLTAME